MNALKLKETRQRLNSTIEDASKQAIISAVAASIYTLGVMDCDETFIEKFYNNLLGLYEMPDDIFGKSVNDFDVSKIVSEKFPGVDLSKMYPLIKVKIQ